MLVLSRKPGQSIVIVASNGEATEITLDPLNRVPARIGINAPDSVRVIRRELVDRQELARLQSPPS